MQLLSYPAEISQHLDAVATSVGSLAQRLRTRHGPLAQRGSHAGGASTDDVVDECCCLSLGYRRQQQTQAQSDCDESLHDACAAAEMRRSLVNAMMIGSNQAWPDEGFCIEVTWVLRYD